jgi:phage terminase small subunit
VNEKQGQFVREYLIDLNATQAAIRAGYSAKTAHVNGPRLLTHAEVSRAIEAAKAERAAKNGLDADWVLSRLRRVAERCLVAEPVMRFDPVEKDMVQATAVHPETGEEVGVYAFDSKGANGALKLLGDHLGLYVKKVEVTGANGGAMRLDIVDRPPRETREEWEARRKRETAT